VTDVLGGLLVFTPAFVVLGVALVLLVVLLLMLGLS
jgi:hypothetical protein